MNHVFEVPKHSINKSKWNFLTVFSNSINLSVKKSSKKFRKYIEFKKITVHGAVCSQWVVTN